MTVFIIHTVSAFVLGKGQPLPEYCRFCVFLYSKHRRQSSPLATTCRGLEKNGVVATATADTWLESDILGWNGRVVRGGRTFRRLPCSMTEQEMRAIQFRSMMKTKIFRVHTYLAICVNFGLSRDCCFRKSVPIIDRERLRKSGE